MAKKPVQISSGFWIALAVVIVAVMYQDEIAAYLAGGNTFNINTPTNQLPEQLGSCTKYNLDLEFVTHFGTANMQTLANGCINNGGDWTSEPNEVSCHFPNTVGIDCNQQGFRYIKELCDQMSATYVCSNTSKFVGCLCNLAAPTAPLDGFADNQDADEEQYTCAWHQSTFLADGYCEGTCATGKCCTQTGATTCACIEESSYVVGQVGSVFVTSASWNGAMGGAVGADEKCSVAAQYAGLSGNWRAIISDDLQAARSKLPNAPTIPYYLLDGTKLANSADDLFDGTINNAINMDEHKNKVADKKVWTGTTADGQTTGSNCHNWGWVSATGTAGSTDSNFGAWINEMADSCNVGKRLYCARVS